MDKKFKLIFLARTNCQGLKLCKIDCDIQGYQLLQVSKFKRQDKKNISTSEIPFFKFPNFSILNELAGALAFKDIIECKITTNILYFCWH